MKEMSYRESWARCCLILNPENEGLCFVVYDRFIGFFAFILFGFWYATYTKVHNRWFPVFFEGVEEDKK